MRSPAVIRENFPGTAWALFGAYRSTLPYSHMFFRFVNVSPPCAAKAARASSIGVELAVIAGGGVIPFVAGDGVPLVEGAMPPALWAPAMPALKIRIRSDGASFFIGEAPSVSEPEAAATGSAYMRLAFG